MPKLKIRFNSAWIDSDRKGSITLDGQVISFGPTGGPTYEAINWAQPPALTDALDGPSYVMGCRFSVMTAKPCYGLRWRVPDIITPAPAAGYVSTLFSISPTIELAQIVFSPVAGADQDILFSAPVDIVPGVQYVTSILTNRYVFRSAASAGGFPFSSPSGNVVAELGKLSETDDPDDVPGSDFQSIYYISPLVGT